MSSPDSLDFIRDLPAAPAEAARAFTHATLLRDWLCNVASTDPRLGGHFYLRLRDGRAFAGTYTVFDPPHRLELAWAVPGEGEASTLRLLFTPQASGTRLTLEHAGLPAAEREAMRAFWESGLENLASMLETGIDLRLARRPRLGIFMEEPLTPEGARARGLPVDYGVPLDGTMEGSGARAAGLQHGDVLVALNGVELRAIGSFDEALSGLKAGDQPPADYIRGGVRHTVPLQLSSFPIMPLPETAADFAAKFRANAVLLREALAAQLAGLTEEQAALRPAEGEWSVNELVAHLALCERDYQSWLAAMLNDRPVEDWLEMRPNMQPRIDALLARLPSLSALLDELFAAYEETAAFLAGLPESFTRDRKHYYRRAAQWALEVTPGHYFEEHQGQFQGAIDAARAG